MDAAEPKCQLGNIEMSDVSDTSEREDPLMHHREIALADGRYMIFYTFGDEDQAGDDQAEDV